jgi:hypothetical protein
MYFRHCFKVKRDNFKNNDAVLDVQEYHYTSSQLDTGFHEIIGLRDFAFCNFTIKTIK